MKMFNGELVSEVFDITKSNSEFYIGSEWSKIQIHQLIDSSESYQKIAELLSVFKSIQEIILKRRLILIISSSDVLSSIFYKEREGINFAIFGREDIVGAEELIQESSSAFDYIDEIFYCLKNAGCRVIKSMDKVAACSIINFINNVIISSDVYRLQIQVIKRFINPSNFSSKGISLDKKGVGMNEALANVINNLCLIFNYIEKLKD